MTKQPLSGLSKRDHNQLNTTQLLCFEDFIPGSIFEHEQGRTITQFDNPWQSMVSLNTHPSHRETVSHDESGKTLVSSLVTFSIVGGLSLASTCARLVTNLGWKNVSLPTPVFVGDTLYAQSRIVAKRCSSKHPNQGIVVMETKGLNQQGEVCLVGERSFLMPYRSLSERLV